LPIVKKIQPVASSKIKMKPKIAVDTVKKYRPINANTVLLVTTATQVTTSNLLNTDTAIEFATTTTKKKLPVVHINELETFPVQFTEPVNYAQTLSDKIAKKAKINNLTIATQQNSIGFKIKLSFKNQKNHEKNY
jgi:uncharacterized protein YwlG (UPF0340 family)